ncbi:MAG: DUF2911 domain-containing protein [Saprospiraceae bacterium]|nr:DUF2911 domain-containing protein [Saprospiraceae bacterium]
MMTKYLIAVAGALCILVPSSAQTTAQTGAFEVPTTNSRATVHQRVAATDIEITYHRPNVKGRIIFGELVPYGRVWRTGADAATTISFSTPVIIEGTEVDAGTYELFTIPGAEQWTVILQEAQGQWGSYSYSPEHDALRVNVKPVPTAHVETFTISLDVVGASYATLNIAWARVRVPVRIEIDLEATVLPGLEAALQADGRRPYFRAAMFYFENDLDINRAAELMALALEQAPGHIGMLYRQALILERKGDLAGARAAAEASLAGAQDAGDELKAEYTRLNKALLERLIK